MKNKTHKSLIITLSILSVLAFALAWFVYSAIFESNVKIENEKAEVFIPEKSTVAEVVFLLKQAKIIDSEHTFLFVSKLKKFQMPSKGGKYVIENGWNNNQIINTLRIGDEVPVHLTFNNMRTQTELSARLAQQLRLDSADVMELFEDYDYIHAMGFDFETIISIFIPNTYQVLWTIDADDLFKRMKREYDAFWNKDRIAKAKKINLSPIEVITLASIVEEETIKKFEKPIVAGVYINRLNKGWKLGADPTVKFAVGDPTLRRILTEHTKIDSPYNTYKYKGLPPGPIRVPDISSIDAVLNYQKHTYMYFCAKPDLSGTHAFATTLREHNNNARQYHNTLNKRKIYK